MDNDRIKGTGTQAKGSVKEAIGTLSGDSKLQTEGQAGKAGGKIKNAARETLGIKIKL